MNRGFARSLRDLIANLGKNDEEESATKAQAPSETRS